MPESVNRRGSSGPTIGATVSRSSAGLGSVAMGGEYRRPWPRSVALLRGVAVVGRLVPDAARGVQVVEPVREAVRIGDPEHAGDERALVTVLDLLPRGLEPEA